MTKDKFLSFSESGFGMPQEEVLEKTHGKKQLNIGIPKEILLKEKFNIMFIPVFST